MTQTIRPNNNTGLYNGGLATIPIDQNLNIVGNLSVGGSISAIGNITGADLLTPGLVSAAGNVTGANVIGVNVIGSNITGGNITGGNLLTSGQVSATGNITGNYILGNVANATGFHPNKIFNGTSEANIGQPNGNLNININGVSNVIVVNTTGEYIQGLLSATGNITGANINTAGILSSTGNIRGANINTAGLVTASGNVTGGNIVTAGNVTGNYLLSNTVSASGNVIATNINVSSISATGNITGCNFNFNNNLDVTGDVGIDGNLVVDGNIAGAYLSGDGRNLTLSTYGGVLNPSSLSSTGAVVAAVLQTSGAVGNIIGVNYAVANYFVGDGTYLTNVTSAGSSVTNGTSNVAVAYNGNTTVAVAGNTVGTFASSGFNVSGAISATGNITGNYFKGNGSQLTGITTTYNNSNVTSLLAAFGSNSISTSGNITAGNALINNQLAVSGGLEAYNGMTMHNGNIVVGVSGQTIITPTAIAVRDSGSGPTITPTSISGPISISATGNITGNYIFGNGSQLTGIAAGYGNSNVTALLATFGSNTISTSGNITGNYIFGNGSQLTGLGATYSNANVTSLMASFGSNSISTSGNVTAGYHIGNGSLLTSLTGSAVTGIVANATYATTAGSATTATTATTAAQANYANIANSISGSNVSGSVAQANYANIANSISGSNVSGSVAQANYANTANAVTGGNVTGQVANALVAGTVYTAAQPNITSVGTLTSLSSSGNITASYFLGNGSQLTGLPATYGDSNVNTLLAAWGSNTLSTTGNVTTGNLVIPTGGKIFGDFANLTSSQRVVFQNNGNSFTSVGAIPGGTYSAVGQTIASLAAFNQTDVGNASFGVIRHYGTYVQMGSAKNGTGGNMPVAIVVGGGGSANVAGNAIVLDTAYNATVTGNITTANNIFGGTVSATGNVTGNYFIGNGSALTGITATAGPGGANTQLQFNNAGSLAGNSNMTFDVTSGNVVVGNIYYNGLNIVPGGQGPNVLPTGNTNPSRLVIGQGYNGNLNWAYNQNTPGFASGSGPGARVLISDTYNYSSSTAATRLTPLALQNYVVLTANVTGSNNITQGAAVFTMIGGGASANTAYVNSSSAFHGLSVTPAVGYTQNANLSAVGNTSISFMTGIRTGPTVNYGSNVDVVMGFQSVPTYTNNGTTAFANIGNVVAYTTNFSGSSSNANVIQTVAAVGYYHPGVTTATTILQSPNVGATVTTGNIARMATSYYAFRNDDDLAMSKLGSLSQFHEYSYGNNSTTGSITINKTNGQVQYIPLTGSLTISGFSNFVTSVTKPNNSINYQTDTVTLILNQGATGGYSVTLPTGATYKYAGGVTTVGATANAVTMISVTGFYNTATSATNYLLTVSPEFA